MKKPILFCLIICLLLSCKNHDKNKAQVAKSPPKNYKVFDKPEGLAFDVSDVKISSKPMADTDALLVFENRIEKEIYTCPEEFENTLLVPVYNNALIEAIQNSFAQHRPLVLSPDIIWLSICQGFSIHVNEKFDSLKKQLFTSDKKKELLVRNDALVTGKAAAWKELIHSLSAEIQKNTKKDAYSMVVQQFSTTTDIEKTAYEITLMESFKKAFSYTAESGCGIPRITLKGKREDWEKIYNEVDKLRDYGLSEWVDNLKPLLKEFVNVFDNKINKKFWQGLYKESSDYGATTVSGWCIKLFPYLKEEYSVKESPEKMSFRYVRNTFIRGEDYHFSDITTKVIPSGFAKIDLKWNNFLSKDKNITNNMEVFAGFLGIRQYKDMSLEPAISWAVSYKNHALSEKHTFPERFRYNSRGWDTMMRHNHDEWVNKTFDDDTNPISKPVYAPQINKTYQAGIDYLRKYLKETIPEASNISVTFTVTWDGTIAAIKVQENKAHTPLCEKVEKALLSLPYTWSPPIYHGIIIMQQNGKDIRVNYRVRLEL